VSREPQQIADLLIAEGNRAEDEGRLSEACDRYRAAAKAAPGYARAHLNLGIGLEAGGDVEGALQAYETALGLDPRSAYVCYNFGKLLATRGVLARAQLLLLSALETKPEFPEASVVLSGVYDAQGNLAAAAAALEAALAQRPDYAGALYNYSTVLAKLGRTAEAEGALQRTLAADPGNVDAMKLLASALARRGRLEEAAVWYRSALAAQPGLADALSDLGDVLFELNRLEEAGQCYRRAIALDPSLIEARHNLCMISYEQGRPADAISCLREVVALNPRFAKAYLSLGKLLSAERRLDEALECFQKAVAAKPDLADAHFSLGNAYKDRDRREEALACYRKALALDPEDARARWSITMSQLTAVYRDDADSGASRMAFASDLEQLERWIAAGRRERSFAVVGSQTPFFLTYQEEDNRELLRRYGGLCAGIMSDWLDRQGLVRAAGTRPRDVVRVGVVSRFFQNHSVWNAIVKGWFQRLDRSRFALHAFYLGRDEDQETRLARSLATQFDQGPAPLHRWVAAIASRELDVLIYPEIGMDPMTVQLASLRLAPVQVSTWGHPETTGLPTIDYFLSAADLEPEGAAVNYTERLRLLPHLGCYNGRPQVTPAPVDLRGLGIDPGDTILICPGTPFKYAPKHDRILARIARRVERCRLVFFTAHPPDLTAKLSARLRAALASEGVDAGKVLAFIPWQNTAEFYGLLGRAHVLLDTIGFSGFNTALQAAECSLPIVTREGRFLRGRLASGILKRMQIPELIAADEAEYVELAARLCRDAEYRAHVRQRIEAGRPALFEDAAPIRALEEFLAHPGAAT